MQAYFKNGGKLASWSGFSRRSHRPVFECYLPWLVRDVQLAQQVLEAWNAIVERGEADKVRCPCKECRASYGQPESSESSASSSDEADASEAEPDVEDE